MRNMKNRLPLAVLVFVALGALTAVFGQVTDSNSPVATNPASAAVPRLVKFGGTVKDVQGKPMTGVVGITFALYKDQEGGTPLWLETQNVQPDAKGHYTIMLGSMKSDGLPLELFSSNEARWIGVQPQGQNEQPRVLLVSAPYALKAADAETLGGKPLSAFRLVTPQSSTSSSSNAVPLAEQTNEIRCSGSTACKIGFIPEFSSNGGSATVNDSIITQSGTAIGIAGSLSLTGNLNASTGQVLGQTGFFQSSNSGAIFQATQNNSTNGAAIAGVAKGTSGIGVEGSGVTGVSGIGLSNGTGVAGQGSTGVFGFAGATSGSTTGVFGEIFTSTTASAAVLGEAVSTTGQTYGVQGFNASKSNFAAGVSGIADGDLNKTFGMIGSSLSPNGTGVWGLGQGQSVTGGGVGCCVVGIWGDTSSSAAGAAGLVGTADDARAIFLQNNSPSGVPTAFMFQGASGKLALVAGGATGACTVDTNGDLACHGSKSAVVPVDNGQHQVALYAVEAPQNWFEDFGNGHLASGAARVVLESTFGQTVNTDSEYHVFLTPEGDCRGLYVSNKSAAGFEVHELGGGQSNVAFDYRIVALRRGYESVRLEDKTEMMAKLKANVLKPSTKPGERWMPQRPPKPPAPALPSNRAVVAPAKVAVGAAK